MTNTRLIVKLSTTDFLYWYFDENSEKSELRRKLVEGHINGLLPIRASIKNDKDFFNFCEYLPVNFILNWKIEKKKLPQYILKVIKDNDDELSSDLLKNCDFNFIVKWI